MTLQEAIKMLRVELGLTQTELANKLQINYSTISRWEHGKNFPQREVASKVLEIVRKLNVSSECKSYLEEVLMPSRRRIITADQMGFPELDQELLCQVVDGSTNAVYIVDMETYQLVYVNRMTENMFHYSFGVSKENRCYKVLRDKDKPCEDCPFQYIESGNIRERLLQSKDGQTYYGVRGKKLVWNNRTIYISYISDVTKEEQYKAAVYDFTNQLPNGVAVYQVYHDGQVKLLHMNNGFYEMLKTTRKESSIQPGFTQFQAVHPEDRQGLQEEIVEAIKQQRVVKQSFRIQIKTGQYREIILRGKKIKEEQDGIIFYCTFVDKVTDYKES